MEADKNLWRRKGESALPEDWQGSESDWRAVHGKGPVLGQTEFEIHVVMTMPVKSDININININWKETDTAPDLRFFRTSQFLKENERLLHCAI